MLTSSTNIYHIAQNEVKSKPLYIFLPYSPRNKQECFPMIQ